jgi:hypothetical protein
MNPKVKKRKLIQEDSGAGIYSGDTVSASSGYKTEYLPEAICEFNVLEPSSVSARKHNANIPTFWEEMITHTLYAKPWTDNQTTFTLTKILSVDEKGVQVMTETGIMSAKGSVVTDCNSLLYTGVAKDIFFNLVKLMKIENTFSFQLDVADQLMKLILSLLFDDLAR